MNFSSKGIPILHTTEKCAALAVCLIDGSHEDAEGHIWDLLNLLYEGDVPKKWVKKTRKMYGEPTPIQNTEIANKYTDLAEVANRVVNLRSRVKFSEGSIGLYNLSNEIEQLRIELSRGAQ